MITIFIVILFSASAACWSVDVQEECVGPYNPIVEVKWQGLHVRKVVAHIRPEHLDKGSVVPTEFSKKLRFDMGCRDVDHAGHIIAKSLGGCGDKFGNVFPQHRTINMGAFNNGPERMVRNAVKAIPKGSNDYVEYTVELFYADRSKTRPHYLRYRIVKVQNNGRTRIVQAEERIDNPKGADCVRTT